jgi:hypothetical protein
MMDIFNLLVLFSAVSFILYGINCLRSPHIIKEFQRFGISHGKRKLTGILQLLGALGLLLGMVYTPIGLTSALGLFLLMLLGLGVRIKVRDGVIKSFPAFFFMLLNLYLTYGFWVKRGIP